MSSNHYDVAVHFATRKSDKNKRGHSVFTDLENTSIFSYGRHFEMARAIDERNLIVVNGDRYGPTTSRHQSDVRGALRTYLPKEYKQITIPFEVLRRAGVSIDHVHVLDTEPDYEVAECHTHNRAFSRTSADTAYALLEQHRRDNTKLKDSGFYGSICETHYEHHLGGSLFRSKGPYDDSWKYFLSGFDETHNSNTDGYFISLLPHPVKTIAAAYESLKPLAVRKAIAAGIEVKRQGDAFAIPVPDLNTKRMIKVKSHFEDIIEDKYIYDINSEYYGTYQSVNTGRRLNIPTFGLIPSHGANEVAFGKNVVYARGSLIHSPAGRDPEHKRIPLGKIWHKIYRNTAKASWASATGKVD